MKVYTLRIYPVKPEQMTAEQRKRFLQDRANTRVLYACCHGHVGCSVERLGPCWDDVELFMLRRGELNQ